MMMSVLLLLARWRLRFDGGVTSVGAVAVELDAVGSGGVLDLDGMLCASVDK